MGDASAVANGFIQHYYSTMSTNRAALQSLYADCSTLSFEGASVAGAAAIAEKYKSLGALQHSGSTMDFAPGPGGSLVIVVTGNVRIESNPPLHFSQTFTLVSTSPGNFYVHNDIFRFVYA